MRVFKKAVYVSGALLIAVGVMLATPGSAWAQWYGTDYYARGIGVGGEPGYGASVGDRGLWGDDDHGDSDGMFSDSGVYDDYNNYYDTDFENQDEWGDWW